MPRDVTHNGKNPVVQVGFPDLVARKVGVNTNHLDHLPPKDREVLFCQRVQAATSESASGFMLTIELPFLDVPQPDQRVAMLDLDADARLSLGLSAFERP